VKGFLGNLPQMYHQAVQDAGEWAAFCHAWYQWVGEQYVKVSDLLSSLDSSLWLDSMPSDISGLNLLTPRALQTKLGVELKKRRGAHFGGYRLETKYDEHTKSHLWRVIRLDETPTPSVDEEEENPF